jgi:hypothetical protein
MLVTQMIIINLGIPLKIVELVGAAGLGKTRC